MVGSGRVPVRRPDLRRWGCSPQGGGDSLPGKTSLPGAGSVAGDDRYSWQQEQRVRRHGDETARPNTPKLGTMAGAADGVQEAPCGS